MMNEDTYWEFVKYQTRRLLKGLHLAFLFMLMCGFAWVSVALLYVHEIQHKPSRATSTDTCKVIQYE